MSVTRITLVADSQQFGGAEAYLARLAAHLPDRYAPELLASPPIPAPLEQALARRGARVLPAPRVAGKADVLAIARMAAALRATRPHLVHVNLSSITNNRHALGLAAVAWPTVATLHLVAAIESGVQRRILAAAFARVRRVIAVSEAIAMQLRDELGIPYAKISLIHNGVEEAPAVQIHEHGAPVRVGGVGRLTRQKGFDVLLQAIRRMLAEDVAVEAVIAGDGPERAALERQAEGLPVAFQGWVQDVGAFLAGLDVFCLPSRWEGLPFALLEAMMRGLPCVCTPVGDVPAAAGETCVFVASEDPRELAAALCELARSPERRRELGRAARERALARHTVQRMAAATAALYDEVLGSG
jgi:glycosyltransferase involved in cell wall biosynthesis